MKKGGAGWMVGKGDVRVKGLYMHGEIYRESARLLHLLLELLRCHLLALAQRRLAAVALLVLLPLLVRLAPLLLRRAAA